MLKMAGSENYLHSVIQTKPYGWEFINDSSAPVHFAFEEIDHSYWFDVFSNWKIAISAGVGYVITIFALQEWMKSRPAYDLKGPLFWWNLTLGIFSVLGFSRSVPGFLGVLGSEGGFYKSICVKTGADVGFQFWITLFVLSKLFELGDTVFIVLRKRPLIFLQWYHHVATLIVTWIVSADMEPVVRWYIFLNYGVHALMYNYFALKAIGWRIPNPIAKFITTLQFVQMIIGFGVNMLSMYYTKLGYGCARYPLSIQLFLMLYGSFLFLFGKLFYDSVIGGKRNARGKREATTEKKTD